ncbi:MAG: Cysteine--tRNA ligase [Planctomycetes bacterium ADurb.Bin401]|nr:MAG: Cysteine--tRNA ligase [Planctomycetes bacterium ADurb.Bin401]
MRLYNTLTHKIEEFVPMQQGKVGMYSCGPTVYSHPHIGNFRSFLVADLLKRFLEFKGYQVTHIMNITDVGHLVDDADEGADKLEEAAKKQKKNPLEIAQFYTDSFMQAGKLLNLKPATRYPKATEHIPQMIEMVKSLINKGYAYVVGNNVYYDVEKFAVYGRLSGNTLEELNAGARIEINQEKKNPQDFALWKHDPKHLQQWDSPWGKGFPGWHIECSAMSSKYLGDEFDIHTGGEDNIFPHHECEIAQSEAASGKKFVHYWLHTRFLMFDGEKMSKSKGNLYTIQELIEKGFKKNAIRYSLISSHYRQNYNFTFDGLKASQQAIDKIQQCVNRLAEMTKNAQAGQISQQVKDLSANCLKDFDEALSDDLNISKALAVVFDFVREANKKQDANSAEASALLDTMNKIDSVLGILEANGESEIPANIVELAEKRKAAKAAKDWKAADAVRAQIASMGWTVEDTPGGGYRLKRAGDAG